MATAATLAPDTAGIPQELIQRPQWVVWRYVKKDGKKPTKVPYIANPKGELHGAKTHCNDKECAKKYEATGEQCTHAQQTWRTFDDALQTLSTRNDVQGIGYVFSADDPYAGVDLDHCRDKDACEIAEWAQTWIDAIDSYSEISPSGEGVKIILRASMAADTRHKRGNYEAYDQERFFTVTGQRLDGTPATIEARQAELDAFVAACLPRSTPKRASAPQPQYAHSGGFLDLDDGDILATALNDAKFAALWYGDTGGYPSHSEAVFALLRKLDFYTWGDAGRMDRFFRQSGLMSDKWDTRRGDTTLGGFNIQKILDTSTGERASYLHLLRSEHDAGDQEEDTPEPEPENVVLLRARIVELEAMVAQLENELAGSRDANKRLSREITDLKEYKRSRDEAEERRSNLYNLTYKRLSLTHKAILDSASCLILSAVSRGRTLDDGRIIFPVGKTAENLGTSDDTVSRTMKYGDEMGLWQYTTDKKATWEPDPQFPDDPKKGRFVKHSYVLPNLEIIKRPRLAVALADEAEKPERNHGGDRRCPECGSEQSKVIKVTTKRKCNGCGHEWETEKVYPQVAGTGNGIYLMPQVAGTGSHTETPPLCLQERDQQPMPQVAGTAPRQVSHARAKQEYELYRWAKTHGWAKLPYVGGSPIGGDPETWGQDIRKATDKQIALAYATITAQVAAS